MTTPGGKEAGSVLPTIDGMATMAVPDLGGRETVDVWTRVPHRSTRVTVTIEVTPEPSGVPVPSGTEIRAADRPRSESFLVGGGRNLPNLLFVTSRDALAENIGEREASWLLGAMRDQGVLLHDELPAGTTDAAVAAALVRPLLRMHRVEGVVLVGGYDVVPSQVVDALDADLRGRMQPRDILGDQDRFYVWNDDIYGDHDGDGLPELPVSRIPDGRSPQLVFGALQASGPTTPGSRFGLRNALRPFAEQIFEQLPGGQTMLASEPITAGPPPPYDLKADLVYIMLHGSDHDTSRFWGETAHGAVIEAVNVSNLLPSTGCVVFTGCCWGALVVDQSAGLIRTGEPISQRTAGASLALGFLNHGATAFVGCTGAHYSPIDKPYNYFGGPLHRSFWSRHLGGVPPAKALFEAKKEYIAGVPHRSGHATSEAIERKIWRQYTCLGLGW